MCEETVCGGCSEGTRKAAVVKDSDPEHVS